MNYNQTDYLGDLKASLRLVEQIKAYYIAKGISLNGVSIKVVPEIDQYGSKYYSIRSNLVHDLKSMTLKVGPSAR